jgi:hypothetical protein
MNYGQPNTTNFNPYGNSQNNVIVDGHNPYGNSPILNEIHTHFPALLYDSTQFRSVNDVFGYVNEQMQNRYDVFSSMRRQYRQTHAPVRREPAYQRRRHYAYQRQQTQPLRTAPPLAEPESTQSSPIEEEPLTTLANNLIQSIQSESYANNIVHSIQTDPFYTLFFQFPQAPQNFADAVPVVPTVDQVERGSTIHTTLAEVDTPCAICQDTIAEGETVRSLASCSHVFHRNCIDTWYQRNVHCPVCRADIRH